MKRIIGSTSRATESADERKLKNEKAAQVQTEKAAQKDKKEETPGNSVSVVSSPWGEKSTGSVENDPWNKVLPENNQVSAQPVEEKATDVEVAAADAKFPPED